MKQSESNLFSGGMNLDANPIAIDNKSLHSALNATMITMNGNELILQNDMGNVEVGTAKLPNGYVPIGMKEFGGIVYVAAYNPLKRTSLIGSFPSPLQQSESDSNKDDTTLGGFTTTKDDQGVNIDIIDKYTLSVKVSSDKLRPGDKFYIVISEALKTAIESGCYTYDICILDSSNSLVPITDKLVIDDEVQSNPTNPGLYTTAAGSNKYYYYKGNLVGYVYFKLSLNIPEFFQYSIIGREDNDEKFIDTTLPYHPFITKYKIVYTQSYDSTTSETREVTMPNKKDYTASMDVTDKREWPKIYTEKDPEYESKTVTLDNIVTIKITPYFEETATTLDTDVVKGYLDKLTYTCTVNLNKLGSGQIDFSEFRYYTNVNEGTVLLNYSLMSYLNSTQIINSLELVATPWSAINKLKDKESITIGATNNNGVTIVLSNGSYNLSGSFLKTIDDLAMETIYVAALKCTIGTIGNDADPIIKYGKPFVLITSELVNGMYTSTDTEYIDGAEEITIPQTITATYGDDVYSVEYSLGSTSRTVDANTTTLEDSEIYSNAKYTIHTNPPDYTSTLNVAKTAFDGLFKPVTTSATSKTEVSDTRADCANKNNLPTPHENTKPDKNDGTYSNNEYIAYSEFVTKEKLGDVLTYNLYGHLPYLGDATCEDVLLASLIPVSDGTDVVGNAVSRWFTHIEYTDDGHPYNYSYICTAAGVTNNNPDKCWGDATYEATKIYNNSDWKGNLENINTYFETLDSERPLILFFQWLQGSNRVLFPPETNPTLYRKNFSIPMLMASNGKYYALNEYGFAYQPDDTSFTSSTYTYPSQQSEIDSLRELLNNVFIYQSTKPQIYTCKIVTADKDNYYYDGDYTVIVTHTATIPAKELEYTKGTVTSIKFSTDGVISVPGDGEEGSLTLPKCKTEEVKDMTSSLNVNISGQESFALLALSADGNPSLGNGLFDGEKWHFDKYYNPGEVYFKINGNYYTIDQVVNMYYIQTYDASNDLYLYKPVYPNRLPNLKVSTIKLYVKDGDGYVEQDVTPLDKNLFALACQFKDGLFEYKTSSEYNSIGGIYLGSKYATNFAAVGGHIFRSSNTMAKIGMLLIHRFEYLNTNRLTDITAADSNYNG